MNAASRLCAILTAAALVAGCAPNQANIQLRKQNQQYSEQVNELQLRNAALAAQLAAEENRAGSTTQQLAESRLDKLYTVHGLEFGKLTGGFSPDPSGPDTMVKAAVCPIDQDGEPLKAAGAFKIELFDLSAPDTRIGTWSFSTEEAKAHWFGRFVLYTYVFDLPWQTAPQHAKLVLRVTFTDDLTGREFAAQRDVEVKIK